VAARCARHTRRVLTAGRPPRDLAAAPGPAPGHGTPSFPQTPSTLDTVGTNTPQPAHTVPARTHLPTLLDDQQPLARGPARRQHAAAAPQRAPQRRPCRRVDCNVRAREGPQVESQLALVAHERHRPAGAGKLHPACARGLAGWPLVRSSTAPGRRRP
jgi:hypothetical protein